MTFSRNRQLPRPLGAIIGTLVLSLWASVVLAAPPQKALRAWQQGRSLIEQGLQESAIEPLRKASRLAPEDVDIQRDYMDLMKARGFHREVVEDFRQRLDRSPTPLSHYLYGRATGDIEIAAKEFEKALALNPSHLWSIQGLGGVAAVQGRYDDALALYSKAAALAPQLAEIQNKIANVHLARGDPAAAVSAWREAMRLAPSDYHAYLNLGAVRSMEGDLEGAADLLGEAVRRAAGNPLAHVNYAYVLFKLKRFEDSLAHFAAAIAINPRDRTIQGSRDLVAAVAEGLIPFAAFAPYEKALASQVTDPKKAAQYYREVLLLAPNFATAHMNLGLVLVSLKNKDDALRSLARAAELAPDNGGVRYNLGYFLLGLGQGDEAEGHLVAAHRLVPEDVDALVALAMLALSRGKRDQAKVHFEGALRLQPRSPSLWAQLATVQAEAGALDKAITTVRKALEISPGFVAGRIQLIAILRQARQFDEALNELEKLEEIAPGHPDLAAERAALESARAVQTREAAKPGRLGLSRILVSDRALADRLHAQLAQGVSFESLALKHSEGPERAHGGDVGFVDPQELRPEIQSALTKLRVGTSSPVIDLGSRFLILKRTR